MNGREDYGSGYARERENIIKARDANPFVGASTLARKLASGEIVGGGLREFYSIYSVIRRHDAKRKQLNRVTLRETGEVLSKPGPAVVL